jgi:tRNA (guanine37-N1)-methyltransferase
MKLIELLKEKLNEQELKLVPRSFDIIGSKGKAVAIVKIRRELESKDKLIAEAIMKLNKNVKSVLKKLSGRVGKYRLYNLELIAGDENTEVIHKEYGYLIKVDPRKAYFSPREATERQRIASQVKPNEIVMLMFAGTGVYGIAICKKQPNLGKVIAIEINPDAFYYMQENIRINKLSDKIIPILGDVEEKCKDYFGCCDRVIMPFAIEGWKYLETAIKCLKQNGILHFYFISSEERLFQDAIEILMKEAEKLGRKVEVLSKRIVGRFGVRMHKVCIDAKIT